MPSSSASGPSGPPGPQCPLSSPTLVLNRSWLAIQTTTARKAFSMLYADVAQAVNPETYEVHDFESWMVHTSLPTAGNGNGLANGNGHHGNGNGNGHHGNGNGNGHASGTNGHSIDTNGSKGKGNGQGVFKAHEPVFVRTVSLLIRVPEVILLRAFDGHPRTNVPFTRKNIYRRDDYKCQYCGVQPGSADLTIDHVLPCSRRGKSTWTNCVLACVRCNKRKGNRTPEEAGMTLLKRPVKPRWHPVHSVPVSKKRASWAKFLSPADMESSPQV